MIYKQKRTKQIEELRDRKNFTKPSKRKRLQKEETIRKNKLFLYEILPNFVLLLFVNYHYFLFFGKNSQR